MKKLSVATLLSVVAALFVATAAFALFFNNGNFETGSWTPGWDAVGQRQFLRFTGGYDATGFPNLSGTGDDLSVVVGGPGVTALSLSDPNTATIADPAGVVKYPAVGSYSARINSESSYNTAGSGQNANTLYQTTTVDAADVDALDGKVHLRLLYSAVMVDPTGFSAVHTAAETPMFFLEVKDFGTVGTPLDSILVHKQSYAGEPGVPWQTGPAFINIGTGLQAGTWKFLDWTLVDVVVGEGSGPNSVVGHTLSVKVVATGCSQGGHPGYVYLDEVGSKRVGIPALVASGPATILTGATITYTYNYYNGSVASINPTISATEPPGVTFTSTGLPPECSLAGGTVTCNFTGLAAAAGGSFQIQGTVTAPGGATLTHATYTIAAAGFPTLSSLPVVTLVTAPPPLPGVFGKTTPPDGAANVALSTPLAWGSSSSADSYEYCLETDANDTCDGGWTSVAALMTASPVLLPATTYNWQVRAVNITGTTEADTGTWWNFSTSAVPGAFGKTTPLDGALAVPITTPLLWGVSANAASYEYCLETDGNNVCDGSWFSVAGLTTASPVLLPGTTYNWQARAVNISGTTEANSGTWWNFSTLAAPSAFGKTTPPDAAANVATSTPLVWGTSVGAASYEYCLELSPSTTCGSWVPVAGVTASPTLAGGVTYNWQVRAINTSGATYADAGTWWSFSTAITMYTITGNAAGTPDVTLTYNDGGVKTVVTGPTGLYTITVPGGWSGDVTPSKPGYADFYIPAKKTYVNVTANQVKQNYGAQVTFRPSVPNLDGYVTELAFDSHKGGAITLNSPTFRVGDDAQNRRYYGILNFWTAKLPDVPVDVFNLKLRLKLEKVVGANPFSYQPRASIAIAMKTGAFGLPGLEKTDFEAAATAPVAGSFNRIPAAGWYKGAFYLAGKNSVNMAGNTQLRLRFDLNKPNDTADYVSFYTGLAPLSDNRPYLIIQYFMP